jgi:hypothetical protein
MMLHVLLELGCAVVPQRRVACFLSPIVASTMQEEIKK